MPSIIQAGNAASTGLVTTGATDGILELRSGTTAGGTVAMTVDAAQNIVLAKGISVGASAAPAFSAFQSSVQVFANNVSTKVQFQSKEFDTAVAFDATTNFRFTPQIAGYYLVSAFVTFGANANVATELIFTKNSSLSKRGGWNSGTDFGSGSGGSATFFLNGSTDFVEVFSKQLSGSTINTSAAASDTYFQAFLARSA